MLWLLPLVAALPLWEQAIEESPDPKAKSDDLSYFVVDIEDPYILAQHHGWKVENAFPIANHWLLSHPSHLARRNTDALKLGAKQVYDSTTSKLQRRASLPLLPAEIVSNEFNITSPLFKNQWFLYNDIEDGHDMDVLSVWRRNITGNGVTVAIVDDGLDFKHPDFKDSFSKEGSWDYNRHVNLPEPLLFDDSHGTRCAGEVAASKNGVCGVGIAPGAKVAGIRILSGRLSTDDEARSLIHRYHINDIYSCSWGPTDDGKTMEGPPALVRRAELEGIENGRHGRGSIYVIASGNGAHKQDNCNFDGYTNSIYSITISAVDRKNSHPYYSESCPANLAATYSSNFIDKITTTDRYDSKFPNSAECTHDHTGTSAAAPIAAAVFALVLEQRPELTWRDLQYLVRDTAKSFEIEPSSDPYSVNWIKTADGHHYHNSYGYGLLDADAIVARAATWELVKPQTWYFHHEEFTPFEITPNSFSTTEISPEQWESANMDHIEHVRLRISYQHFERGMPIFRLISPAGIVSELAASRPNDRTPMAVKDWEFMSVVHWNETGTGTWKLEVQGPDGYQGAVRKWQLKLFGQARDVSKIQNYSEVWDEYEEPAALVHDAIDDALSEASTVIQTKTQAIPPPPTSTIVVTPPTSSEEPTKSAEPVDNAEPTPKKSVNFIALLAMVTIISVFIIGIYAIQRFMKRKKQSLYANIDDSNVDLDEFNDDFEIEDDESVDYREESLHDDSAAGGSISKS